MTIGKEPRTEPQPYEPHIGETRQYWRDIILGVNDGLVSMYLLVVGVVGGGLDNAQVLLTGLAGALAGAISMAAGEYLATKSQDEVLEAELALERVHIKDHRAMEVGQLREMFSDMGIADSDLEGVVGCFRTLGRCDAQCDEGAGVRVCRVGASLPLSGDVHVGRPLPGGLSAVDRPLHRLRHQHTGRHLGLGPRPRRALRGGGGQGEGHSQQLGDLGSGEHDDRGGGRPPRVADRRCRRDRSQLKYPTSTRSACNS